MSNSPTLESEVVRQTTEAAKCYASFPYFLKYAKIVEAPQPGQENSGGVIPFTIWPHLKRAIRLLLSEKLLVWMKSRQIGASWLIAAYVLWYALSKHGSNILLFSKGETEAIELLAKCKRIYRHLPEWIKLPLGAKSQTEVSFPDRESNIKALAATETAGISFTASVIVCDEWEEHPYADENYAASKPTRDAGGQFIGIFTVNKQKPDTLAKAIFREALDGKNSFTAIFDPWWVRPGRDESWYEETKRNIPERDLSKLTPELYMEQNYPSTIEEALRMTQITAAFDFAALDAMMEEVRQPIKIEGQDFDSKIVRVYKPFHLGNYYVAATDASHGVGKDYGVTVIMNCRTGEVVADILGRNISPEELAYHTVKLLKYYKYPLWFPEDNEWGRVVIVKAQELDEARRLRFGYSDKAKTKEGFHTGKDTRIDLFGALIPAINNRQITIYNPEGIKQFYDVIRNTEKAGRIEARPGRNDDYPMAVGIAWLKKDEVKPTEWKAPKIKTLTFGGCRS